jgi:hypothetical protein
MRYINAFLGFITLLRLAVAEVPDKPVVNLAVESSEQIFVELEAPLEDGGQQLHIIIVCGTQIQV